MRLLIALLLAAPTLSAATSLARAPLPLRAPVQDKNFYVLSLLSRSAAVRNDGKLSALTAEKFTALQRTTAACALDCSCFAAAMRFSDDEIADAADSLRRLY